MFANFPHLNSFAKSKLILTSTQLVALQKTSIREDRGWEIPELTGGFPGKITHKWVRMPFLWWNPQEQEMEKKEIRKHVWGAQTFGAAPEGHGYHSAA